jgi:GDP-4-dehydro-6-deoxy-D-mannose reductase
MPAPPQVPNQSGPAVVTGAGGFAGSHLVEHLSGQGVRVIAWHKPGGHLPHLTVSDGIQPEAVDLLDRAAVRSALERARPASVYHCAGAAHVGRSWDSAEPTFAVNVRGTHHLVESLRDLKLRARMLITSSAMVYAASDQAIAEDHPIAPASPYALSKLAQELVASGNPEGPEVFIARSFNHFGPRQDPWFVASGFARRIADIEAGRWAAEIAVGNLESRRDLMDVRDTVRAYRLILERGVAGRPYNVCSGRAIAIHDLLQLMLSRARVPVTVRIDPARYRPNDQPLVLGNPGRIFHELGWQA